MHNSPSDHISEAELFEYLDGQLTEAQIAGVEAHLDSCQTCSQRYTELNTLFSRIAGIPDEELGHDLTPRVLSTLQERDVRTTVWWWLLILQGILGLGLIVFAAPSLLNNATSLSLQNLSRNIFTSFTTELSFWFQEWISLAQNFGQLFRIEISLSLGLPLNSILWLLLLATLTWIIGNSILLRPQLNQTEQ